MHDFSVFLSRHAHLGTSKHGGDRAVMSDQQLPWNADGRATFLGALFSAPKSLLAAFLLSEHALPLVTSHETGQQAVGTKTFGPNVV